MIKKIVTKSGHLSATARCLFVLREEREWIVSVSITPYSNALLEELGIQFWRSNSGRFEFDLNYFAWALSKQIGYIATTHVLEELDYE